MKIPLSILVFILLFLGLPIQINVYTEVGNELGVVNNWLFFGGAKLLYYVTQPLLFPKSYAVFDGDLRVVPNLIFLAVSSIIGTLLISFLLNARKK